MKKSLKTMRIVRCHASTPRSRTIYGIRYTRARLARTARPSSYPSVFAALAERVCGLRRCARRQVHDEALAPATCSWRYGNRLISSIAPCVATPHQVLPRRDVITGQIRVDAEFI